MTMDEHLEVVGEPLLTAFGAVNFQVSGWHALLDGGDPEDKHGLIQKTYGGGVRPEEKIRYTQRSIIVAASTGSSPGSTSSVKTLPPLPDLPQQQTVNRNPWAIDANNPAPQTGEGARAVPEVAKSQSAPASGDDDNAAFEGPPAIKVEGVIDAAAGATPPPPSPGPTDDDASGVATVAPSREGGEESTATRARIYLLRLLGYIKAAENRRLQGGAVYRRSSKRRLALAVRNVKAARRQQRLHESVFSTSRESQAMTTASRDGLFCKANDTQERRPHGPRSASGANHESLLEGLNRVFRDKEASNARCWYGSAIDGGLGDTVEEMVSEDSAVSPSMRAHPGATLKVGERLTGRLLSIDGSAMAYASPADASIVFEKIKGRPEEKDRRSSSSWPDSRMIHSDAKKMEVVRRNRDEIGEEEARVARGEPARKGGKLAAAMAWLPWGQAGFLHKREIEHAKAHMGETEVVITDRGRLEASIDGSVVLRVSGPSWFGFRRKDHTYDGRVTNDGLEVWRRGKHDWTAEMTRIIPPGIYM
ncbi:unnamed protein product [Scytosiphon promiscuus]